jgi:ankyrin repeat protein
MPIKEAKALCGTDQVLVDAAGEGDVKAMKKALREGANVNVIAARGWTPLHWTAVHGYKECSSELLKAGADPNIATRNDKTPLDWARSMEHKELAADLAKVTKTRIGVDDGPSAGEMG